MKDINEPLNQFLEGKAWLHICRDQKELVENLIDLIPDVKFCSGDELNGRVMDKALSNGEAWFRNNQGVSYTFSFPRISSCRTLAPWLYDEGPIYNIEEMIPDYQFDVSESDLIDIFS